MFARASVTVRMFSFLQQVIRRYPQAVLLALAAAMLLPHLGSIPVNIMEARNLISAREMANDHHWLLTTMNGMPRYEKPPLPTWITAFVGITGSFKSLFILRLPVVFLTMAMLIFFYRLLLLLKISRRQCFISGVVLITSFYIFFGGRDNQWDMYAHAFTIISIYFFVRGMEKSRNLFLLSGLFLGFSFLSKGPVSPYVLFIPFIISYLASNKSLRRPAFLPVLAVAGMGLAVGFSWPIYVRLADPVNTAKAFSTEAGRWAQYQLKPFWYYWSFFIQSGIWALPALAALIYPYMKGRVKDLRKYRLFFWWTIISVVFLSVVPEKKSRYLLPVLIPLAGNTGFYLNYLMEEFRNFRRSKEKLITQISFSFTALVILVMPVIVLRILHPNGVLNVSLLSLLTISCIVCSSLIFTGLYRKKFVPVFVGVAALMPAMVVFGIPLSRLWLNNSTFTSAKELKALEAKYAITTYEMNGFTPEIIWDYGSSIPELNEQENILTPLEDSFGVLTIPGREDAVRRQFSNYAISFLTRIDVNPVDSFKSAYNPRLVKNYFLVRKKLPQ